jgi:hypothetical protein
MAAAALCASGVRSRSASSSTSPRHPKKIKKPSPKKNKKTLKENKHFS